MPPPHLGFGGIWILSHQISKLMESQQQFINQYRDKWGGLYVRQNFYQSKMGGELRKHDVEAQKQLSDYVY